MKQELGKIYQELSSGALSREVALARIRALKQAEALPPAGTVLAEAVWETDSSEAGAPRRATEHGPHQVLLCGLPRVDARALEALLPRSRCEALAWDSRTDIAACYTELALACFERVQGLLRSKPQRRVLFQLAVGREDATEMLAGLQGLLETAAVENPVFSGQILLTSPEVTTSVLARQLQADSALPQDKVIEYTQDSRRVRRWRRIQAATPCESHDICFKEGGAYLITGGLGGLGTVFTREIQHSTATARIILTGRAPLTEVSGKRLRSLQQPDHPVEYRQLDLANLEQVQQLITAIVREHGQLNGIIHSAGLVRDDFILKKTAAQFREVLQPKVTGTYHLDVASAAVPLDFLMLFSSIAAWSGNAGQADYAAANGFMGQFAVARNRLAAAGQRQGRALALLWPHWLEGGMSTDPASMAALRQRTGMGSLDTASGLHALYRCMAGDHSQVLVMHGDISRMERALLDTGPAHRIEAVVPVSPVLAADLTQRTRDFLRAEVAAVLKLPASKVDSRAPLESYGIDSIMAMNLTDRLEQTFGVLAKTLFFEYLTIEELAGYFVQSHAPRLSRIFTVEESPREPAATAATATRNVGNTARAHRRFLGVDAQGTPPSSAPATVSFPAPVTETPLSPREPIAIVGLSGRYPQSPDLEAFWCNLRDGKDCIVEVPPERWDWRQYYSEDRTQPGAHYSKWGGFIEGVDEFDPRFFNIAPREAHGIDPQERLFLQHAWAALEDAGQTRESLQVAQPGRLPGQVGVYAGVMYGEYNLSGTLASIANRVSYFLNLHGPSLTLDTMCSSSLTALHLACQDLRLGRTSLAIAGGVNVSIHPNKYRMLSEGQFISGRGHCQSFGEGGDGYIPGEGVGVAILKRLGEALRDGNHIYGVIRGSALNHGGKTNGYTVPNPHAQADVIRQALADAGVDARHVSYIEAHGTGTKLGDPIEIAALGKAFAAGEAPGSSEVGYCRVGSAKSNIGHCESAAGIAGITKVLLQMKYGQVVPSLHSRKLNPHIDFAATPFVVNQSLCAWERPEVEGRRIPRIAGVSSFGAGGSNAQIVVEEYPTPALGTTVTAEPLAIPLSARTPRALEQRAADLLALIRKNPDGIDIGSLAYTLQVGREPMEERVGWVVSSVAELVTKLAAFLCGDPAIEGLYRGQVRQHKDELAALTAATDFPERLRQWLDARRLPQLLEQWVKGLQLDWRALWVPGNRGSPDSTARLMSLPTYPFARERYWVDPVQAVTVSAAKTPAPPPIAALPPVTPDAPTLRKPSGIVLQPPVGLDLTAAPALQVPSAPLQVFDEGDGVFVIELTAPFAALVEPLLQTLQQLAQEPSLRVLLLEGEGWLGDRGDCDRAIECGLFRAVARFDYPVIAVLPNKASGAGMLLAAVGDFMVCAEEGRYTVAESDFLPNASEIEFLHERLGAATAAAVLQRRASMSGADLRSKGWACRIVPSREVAQDARQLARELAQKPPLALRLLKTHLGRHLLSRVESWNSGSAGSAASAASAGSGAAVLPATTDRPALADRPTSVLSEAISAAVSIISADCVGGEPTQTAGTPLPLRSGVVSASVFPEGIVLVSLHDRQAKNMFSPELVAGLKEAFALIEQRAVDKVVVLTGYDSYFASGGTRETLLAIQQGQVQFTDEKTFQLPLECPLPVIAAMQGHAIGGGWSFGMFADFALLSQESRYVSPYMGYGFTPGAGATLVFPQRIGYDLARETLLTAQEFSGEALKVRGIRVPVVARREVLSRALELAQRLTCHSREQLIQWKHEQTRSLRELREATYAGEVAMHEQTFVGQAQTLASIQAKFGPNSTTPGPDSAVSRPGSQPPELTAAARREPAAARSPSAVIARLRELLAQELHLAPEEIDESAQFIDLGLDSITGVTWVRKINAHYGAAIEATKVYSYPTLAEFARYVTSQTASEPDADTPQKPTGPAQNPANVPPAPLPTPARRKLVCLRGAEQTAVQPAIPSRPTVQASAQPQSGVQLHADRSLQPIAVIGMAGQFAKAKNLDELWEYLAAGKSAVDTVPAERWSLDAYYQPGSPAPGKSNSQWLGALEEYDRFDPLFFNISPTEAQCMDPQQRLFLQSCWHAVENAGYSSQSLSGSQCGVFVGCGAGDYHLLSREQQLSAQGFTGAATSILAARSAYFLNLRGPCLAIDTACSSSLVAIATACDSLNCGNCDLALAGGVYVMSGPTMHIMTSQAGMLSPDGRCFTFDQRANGFVPGEGVGVVVLKRLADAEKDEDRILGVLEGWGVNQDGKTNGITAPNEESQTRLIQGVYRKFGIDPAGIQLIEAHGTGTKLGDPIEVAGLKAAFEDFTRTASYCALGSIKSNIGHCLTAAGVAGFIKLLLALQHRSLPPTLNFQQRNEHIELEGSPFYINDSLRPWSAGPHERRRAAISSFGFSGTNAHLVLAEPVAAPRAQATTTVVAQDSKIMLCLSARTETQLRQKAADLLAWVRRRAQATDLNDLAYSLQVGRDQMGERLGLLVDSLEALMARLEAYVSGDEHIEDLYRGQVKRHKEALQLISEDQEMRAMIVGRWLSERKLSKLLDLWVKGVDLDWSLLYGATRPRRIELPGYPFSKERYWIEPTVDADTTHRLAPPSVSTATARVAPSVAATSTGLGYLYRWEVQPQSAPPAAVAHKNVLIVCSGATQQFEDTLRAHYDHHGTSRVMLVRVADQTRQVSDDEWLCGSEDAAGFLTCLRGLRKLDALYFLAMPAPQGDVGSVEQSVQELTHQQQANEVQLLRLVKCLKAGNHIDGKVDTWLLTLDKHSLARGGTDFGGAGVAGLGYSLAQGNYQFRLRNLDLSARDLTGAAERAGVLQTVLAEGASDRGEVIMIRAGRRYRQMFFRLTWPSQAPSGIRHGGVYLILGGSGLIGQVITRNLIEKYRAHVVWLGRSAPDSERVRAALRSCDAGGNNLLYLQADTLQADSLRRAVSRVKERYGQIHGAVFSGMVFGIDNSIEHIPEADFRAVLDIKTLGSLVFHGVLQSEPLDFLCYFSSGQAYSFSGAAKVCGYAAGITFTDTFVRAIRHTSPFAVGTLNWGAWQTFVKERLARMSGVSTRNMGALEDQEGFECFEQFVSALQQGGGVHQVMCMRASQEVHGLMNCSQEEGARLAGKSASVAVSLDDALAIPHEKIAHLQEVKAASELDEWFFRLLFDQVTRLIGSPASTAGASVAALCKRCGVLDKYVAWMDSTLELFTAKGYVEAEGGTIRSWRADTAPSVWVEWETHKQQYARDPDTRPLVSLVDECLRKLPDILRGKLAAMDVIFPNSSVEKVAPLYKDNATADTFNQIVANAVAAYVRQRLHHQPRARVRILEVGAGTGGTSAAVFAALKSYKGSIEEYCYTDLSRAFFFHAEKSYVPDNPYIVCRRLDIEKAIAEQGFEPGSYDLVIATNVLHATRNIRKTLRNAKAALRADGFIVLNEMSQKSLSTHLTFAMLDGWWLFQDPELRIPGCPGLYPAGWQRALEEEGFHSVRFPAEEGHALGNQIVVARSDGIIRQPVQTRIQAQSPAAPARAVPQRAAAVSSPIAPPVDVGQLVRDTVLSCLSATLKIQPETIDVDTAFADYGIDSILGVSFVEQLNARLGCALNTAVIFEYSSVERLSKHVLEAHTEPVESHLQGQVSESQAPPPAEPSAQVTLAPDRTRIPSRAHGPVEIAVIGMSGKFPKADTVQQFWHNLARGVDGVEELPAHYLDPRAVSARKQKGKTRCKWGGILAGRDHFDPLFFNLSPREARSMNPHQRLVMQESWNALEDAGIDPKTLSGSQTGVFVGSEPLEYAGETFTGLSDAIIASRLSYVLNLHGPAFVVNTGCSASAVALHLACESLRNGESDLALAGGVNACMRQSTQIVLDEIDMLSPSGRCFTFDAAGDGTIISESVAMVALKRLEDAIAAGDPIYGTIVASGVNQDGASNGITAPNGAAQEQLITSVYNKFGIDPERISYVEAHGTGTRLGDPVETNALVRAFRKYTDKQEYCAIGSAKSHIGHTAAAAGVTGLIKILLSMQHRTFPKLLNFKQLNPLIELAGSPFFVTTRSCEWKSEPGMPRMAALNSFGHSGTNVHLVVKEYDPTGAPARAIRSGGAEQVIPLSAKTADSLRRKCAGLLDFIRAAPEPIDLCSLAYTLQVGREAMQERVAFVVSSVEHLAARLDAHREGGQSVAGVYEGQAKRQSETLSLVGVETATSTARLWAEGYKVAWSSLWQGETPERMHLPGYPFAQESYWIDSARKSDSAADGALEQVIDAIADESLDAHEGVRRLRRIV